MFVQGHRIGADAMPDVSMGGEQARQLPVVVLDDVRHWFDRVGIAHTADVDREVTDLDDVANLDYRPLLRRCPDVVVIGYLIGRP